MPFFTSPRQWSIRTKSVVVVILYVFALYAVYGGFTMYLLHREAEEARDRFHQTAQMVAVQLDAHLDSGQRQLTEVAALPGLSYGLQTLLELQKNGDVPTWTALHYIFLRSPVFTGGMFLLDREGKVLWTEPPGLSWLGQSFAYLPGITELREGSQLFVSAGTAADQLFGQPHVIMAVPIQTSTGETQGILGGVIDLTGSALVNILGGVSRNQDRFVEIIDQNGLVVASSNKDHLLQHFSLEPQQDASLFTATATLERAPWRVVSGQPRAVVFADVSRLHHLLWWCGFGMILLAIAGGAPFVNKVVGPIKQLTVDAERMAGGDLSQPIVLKNRHDEIATLSRAFERMRVELGRSRAELEQRLREREELIRLKEEFLANISHELRTPLHVVMGYADMLLEQESDELKRSMIGHVRTKANQLFRLISDLMTVSGLNAGKVALQVGSVVVADLLDRLEPLAEQLRCDKELEIVWDCPPPLPLMETDSLRLEQILTNLVTNAVKFTQKGQITIRVRQVLGQGLVIFEVSDTGVGIPAEELPYIFDEFRQVDGSISRSYGGMGLGLALVQKLVTLLQGEISVISQLGQGSTFTVTFPLRLPSTAATSELQSPSRHQEQSARTVNKSDEVEKRVA